MMPKPIPRMHRGILYRSTLEACWAEFFHQLGAKFDVEPTAYELPSGPYLPDLLIQQPWPEPSMWVEIKPIEPHYDGQVVKKIKELAKATEIPAMLVIGQPQLEAKFNRFWCWNSEGEKHEVVIMAEPLFYVVNSDSHLEFMLENNKDRIYRAAFEARRAVRWSPEK